MLSQQESVSPSEVDNGVFAKLLAVTDAGTIDVSGAWDALALERDGLRAERTRYREALRHIVRTWEFGPDGMRGPKLLVAIAKDALGEDA